MATLEGGLLGSDPGALSPAQLEQLRDFKIQTRIANEKYLRTHKEVDLLISGFFRLVNVPLDSTDLMIPWLENSSVDPHYYLLSSPLSFSKHSTEIRSTEKWHILNGIDFHKLSTHVAVASRSGTRP
ncbi:RIIa domain-containing protein 1 isoform X1 [Rhinolophus sinicus]|uniref:RIIa domain-containing protein 1 isoform X1 n=1 Tax=Rhinolophus sinicus TaxID=89399 RepID=UPI003D791801